MLEQVYGADVCPITAFVFWARGKTNPPWSSIWFGQISDNFRYLVKKRLGRPVLWVIDRIYGISYKHPLVAIEERKETGWTTVAVILFEERHTIYS